MRNGAEHERSHKMNRQGSNESLPVFAFSKNLVSEKPYKRFFSLAHTEIPQENAPKLPGGSPPASVCIFLGDLFLKSQF